MQQLVQISVGLNFLQILLTSYYIDEVSIYKQHCKQFTSSECQLLHGAAEDVSGDVAFFSGDRQLSVEQRRIVEDGRMWRQHLAAKEEEHKTKKS